MIWTAVGMYLVLGLIFSMGMHGAIGQRGIQKIRRMSEVDESDWKIKLGVQVVMMLGWPVLVFMLITGRKL